jgi:hypothetical protein
LMLSAFASGAKIRKKLMGRSRRRRRDFRGMGGSSVSIAEKHVIGQSRL